jgi:hypothetical protein
MGGSGSIRGFRYLPANAVWIALFLSGWLGRPASAQPGAELARVEIALSAQVASTLPIKGTIVLRATAAKGEPIRMAVTSPADLSLTLPPGSRWEVSAEIPGFWVARKDLIAGSPDQSTRLTLDLWPLGTVSGVVRFKEKGAPLPRQVLVRSLAAPALLKRPMAPKGAVDCPVDPKGAWSCSLPASTFDLVISAEGSAPVYRWGVQVPAGKTFSLGPIELARGASVAGWVAVEAGKIEPRRCLARLESLVAGGGSLQSLSELRRTVLEREVGKDGFFQFPGLAPGTYTLEVRQPGYPAVRSLPIRVDPGTETLLHEPLVLRHAFDFQLDIHPSLDWLGRPWRAQVIRLGERPPLPIVFDGKADEEGRLAVAGQSAGRFRVSLLDSLGNSLYSGEHSWDGADTGPQPIEVRFVTLEGRVRLGDEPLAAVLWFGGRSGATSDKMEADVDGKFHGVLPHEGMWRVEIEASIPGFPTWTWTDVRASRSGKATLEIALPDTRISGRVVDEQGKPVPKADVAVRGKDLDLLRVTDSTGNFEVRGLTAGPVWLGAQSPPRVSDRVFATLVEGRDAGPIELRLRQTRKLTGLVTSPLGPVVGSRVMILARTQDGGGGVAMTGTDGTFQVDLPEKATRVVAIVSAPGFALRAFDAQAEKESLPLPVTDQGGSLEITLPLSEDEFLRENLVLATYQNGLPVPAAVLSQWASDHGQARSLANRTLRVPEVAPGEYRVCLLPRQLELLLPWSSVPGSADCASGFLAPGATLSLKPARPG